MTTKIALASLLMAWLASPALAEPPNLLTYQGRLKESGSPVTGARTVEVFLCDALSGGSCTTTVAQEVSVANGLFKTTFTVPGAVDLGTGNWYLEVKVGADTYSPRERLNSSPYALHAATAAYLQAAPSAAGVTVSSHMFVTGNVGVGTSSPTVKLHVEGAVRIVDGTQGTGKILKSDASGTASWQTAGGPTVVSTGTASNNTVVAECPTGKTIVFAFRGSGSSSVCDDVYGTAGGGTGVALNCIGQTSCSYSWGAGGACVKAVCL